MSPEYEAFREPMSASPGTAVDRLQILSINIEGIQYPSEKCPLWRAAKPTLPDMSCAVPCGAEHMKRV